jgi:hypothetical protein
MTTEEGQLARVLAELLRIQRWAGGEAVSAARIFGLQHGVESVLRQDEESFGIDNDTQDKVEQMLEDVEAHKQSADGIAIADRLRREGVSETHASRVMSLCRLQSRFLDGIRLVASGTGSNYRWLLQPENVTTGWRGAVHYMELVDTSEGVRKTHHAVWAPAVPRVGEYVTPQGGPRMKVVAVEHVVITEAMSEGCEQHCLVPQIVLQADEDSEK